ncbi:thiol reductant ABC exporter subunit CydD [Paenibacillus larvae]
MGKNIMSYKGIRPVLFITACITFIQSFAILLQAIWLAEVISALFAGQPLSGQTDKIALFAGAFFIRNVLHAIRQKIAYRFAEVTGTKIRQELLNKLFRLGPRFTKTEGTGNLVTLEQEGISQLRTYLELFIPRMIGTVFVPIILLIYVFMQDRVSGIILTVTMPILIIFMILLGLAAKKQMNRQWKSYRILSNHFVDSLRGLETLKVLGRSKEHSGMIGRVSDKYRAATIRTLRVAFLSSFALDFFTMLSVASVAVGLGMRLIDGSMMLETALVVLILAPEYFLPVRELGADYHATLNGKEAGDAIQAILNHPEEWNEGSEVGVLNWNKENGIRLSGVTVRHENEGPASLDDISFTFQGAAKIGIIGESGAGKSTLIDVLAGFLSPTEGTIEVAGKKLASLTIEGWRNQVTYIPQHPYLFHSSLAENVKFYSPEASSEEVEKAIAAAGLAPLTDRFPNGSGEVIGNGGRPLSGGQEQRVALARAFLGNRQVILLDEPTAHLDIETEYELKETMLELFQDKLVFFATHRLHWMRDMDIILVMHRGQVAETGTHEELLTRKGIYYNMIQSQMEGIR